MQFPPIVLRVEPHNPSEGGLVRERRNSCAWQVWHHFGHNAVVQIGRVARLRHHKIRAVAYHDVPVAVRVGIELPIEDVSADCRVGIEIPRPTRWRIGDVRDGNGHVRNARECRNREQEHESCRKSQGKSSLMTGQGASSQLGEEETYHRGRRRHAGPAVKSEQSMRFLGTDSGLRLRKSCFRVVLSAADSRIRGFPIEMKMSLQPFARPFHAIAWNKSSMALGSVVIPLSIHQSSSEKKLPARAYAVPRYGCIISVLIIFGIGVGLMRFDVRGMAAIWVGQALWFMLVGSQLYAPPAGLSSPR